MYIYIYVYNYAHTYNYAYIYTLCTRFFLFFDHQYTYKTTTTAVRNAAAPRHETTTIHIATSYPPKIASGAGLIVYKAVTVRDAGAPVCMYVCVYVCMCAEL